MLNLRDVDVMVCQKCNTTYFKQIKYQISRVANKQEDQCSRPTLASQSFELSFGLFSNEKYVHFRFNYSVSLRLIF